MPRSTAQQKKYDDDLGPRDAVSERTRSRVLKVGSYGGEQASRQASEVMSWFRWLQPTGWLVKERWGRARKAIIMSFLPISGKSRKLGKLSIASATGTLGGKRDST